MRVVLPTGHFRSGSTAGLWVVNPRWSIRCLSRIYLIPPREGISVAKDAQPVGCRHCSKCTYYPTDGRYAAIRELRLVAWPLGRAMMGQEAAGQLIPGEQVFKACSPHSWQWP